MIKLIISSLIWVSASISGAAPLHKNQPQAWGSILSQLNQDPSGVDPAGFAFSNGLEENLAAVYKSELAAIDLLWRADKKNPSAPKNQTQRNEVNQFYFDRISKLNADTMIAANKPLESNQKTVSKDSGYSKVIQEVFRFVKDHPLDQAVEVDKIDPSGQIGFCFGRALFLHYLLLKRGVNQNHIAKIFLLGSLFYEQRMWNFHVVVVVKDKILGAVVLDPLQAKPMELPEWQKEALKMDIKQRFPRARFYVTDPRKFLTENGKYDLNQIYNPLLKTYFSKLLGALQ
ncbi:MAG: hypothetical protein NTV34_05870 [Proteobacteria bacterium]|nr:hypothetical protein [Pseudomonadota bacterium]